MSDLYAVESHRLKVVSNTVELDGRVYNATQISVVAEGSLTLEIGQRGFKLEGVVRGPLSVMDEGDLVTIKTRDVALLGAQGKEDFVSEEDVFYGYSKPLVISIGGNRTMSVRINYKHVFESKSVAVKLENVGFHVNAILSPFLSTWIYVDEGVLYVEKSVAGISIAVSGKASGAARAARQS